MQVAPEEKNDHPEVFFIFWIYPTKYVNLSKFSEGRSLLAVECDPYIKWILFVSDTWGEQLNGTKCKVAG
jgi:hypothetical protein